MPTISTTSSNAPAGSPSRKVSPKPASASSLSPASRSARPARPILCGLRLWVQTRLATCDAHYRELDIPPLDLFGQRLHDVGDVLEMWVDRQRLAVGFERVLVVANVLQDEAKARPRAEVARLERQHLADVGERMAVIVFQIVEGGALVPGFDVFRVDGDDSAYG